MLDELPSYSSRRPIVPRPPRSVAAHESANETKESRKVGYVRVWRSSLMCEGPFCSRRHVVLGCLRGKKRTSPESILMLIFFFYSLF